MSVRTETKVIIICDKCDSENIEITKTDRHSEKKHKEQSWNLDYEYWVTDSYKKVYYYKCNDCGHEGIEFDDKIYS